MRPPGSVSRGTSSWRSRTPPMNSGSKRWSRSVAGPASAATRTSTVSASRPTPGPRARAGDGEHRHLHHNARADRPPHRRSQDGDDDRPHLTRAVRDEPRHGLVHPGDGAVRPPAARHDERYAYGQEWLDFVEDLWSRYGDFDVDGKYFYIEGCPRVSQADPEPSASLAERRRVTQAGQEFSARNVDINLIALPIEETPGYIKNIKALANDKYQRDIQVWTYWACHLPGDRGRGEGGSPGDHRRR